MEGLVNWPIHQFCNKDNNLQTSPLLQVPEKNKTLSPFYYFLVSFLLVMLSWFDRVWDPIPRSPSPLTSTSRLKALLTMLLQSQQNLCFFRYWSRVFRKSGKGSSTTSSLHSFSIQSQVSSQLHMLTIFFLSPRLCWPHLLLPPLLPLLLPPSPPCHPSKELESLAACVTHRLARASGASRCSLETDTTPSSDTVRGWRACWPEVCRFWGNGVIPYDQDLTHLVQSLHRPPAAHTGD